MKVRTFRLIEALLQLFGDIFRSITYTLLIIYAMPTIFDMKLNLAFPFHISFLLVAAMISAVLMLVFRLAESYWAKRS